MSSSRYRILFIPSPVGPLGKGLGGGVETNVYNLSKLFVKRGHTVGIVCAKGSKKIKGVTFHEVKGNLPPYAPLTKRGDKPSVDSNGLLENMWVKANEVQALYDVIIGINYDWLAYYLTTFFKTPVLHYISMGSTNDIVDAIIKQRYLLHPSRFAVNTKAQAKTFSFLDANHVTKLYGAIDLEVYRFCPRPQKRLSWVGRISPEKNIEDAFYTAQALSLPLDICGIIQDIKYWTCVLKQFPHVTYTYHGFLTQKKIAKVIGNTSVFLHTAKRPYLEAFGNVCAEALSCGTPVVSFNDGGPKEIIENGKSGYIVEGRNRDDYVKAVEKAINLKRQDARARGESFSLEKMGERCIEWIKRNL